MAYDYKKIEKKWQKKWEQSKPWRAPDSSKNPKYYALIEFPYPSGDGLHVGHVRSYTAMDVVARKRRMEGFNVLYPIGWDSFGLPTENYAIKTGTQPDLITKKNTDTFRRQLKSLGLSFDWQREINTSDPSYYKWTQWIFLQFLKHGLAYKDTTYINWCDACKIGLSNEEVVNGVCERCGGEVIKKLKKQWMLRITAYADKLLEGLNQVDFLKRIKIQQENWIGRSEGRNIEFSQIKIFTTRPDTIDGVTYIVLAPEHPLVGELIEKNKVQNKKEVERYIKGAFGKTDLERQGHEGKSGVELKGVQVVNPYNKEKLSVWVSDYVLMQYGTGAVMAVPEHDQRDREFAEKYDLPVKKAPLVPRSKWPGKREVHYKLRDWIFSRQRYWGEPIPVIFCEKCGYVAVPDKDLPVKLPKLKNYEPRPDGKSPLASATSWLKVKCPSCRGDAQRETDTMPNWAGSSWYFLRYSDSKNKKSLADREKLKHWMPVDWYNGGMEHTTLHLLYSRFWNLFLHDIGVVPMAEPYKKRTSHGLILGEGGIKMSKSKGNVINPDDLVKEFGADSLRLYEMFVGPFDESVAWDPKGIIGMERFLNRVWNLSADLNKKAKNQDGELETVLHQTIKKVSGDIEEMKFNTAVSSLMILVNEMEKRKTTAAVSYNHFLILLKLLFPFAPHFAQELWQNLGGKNLLDNEPWPEWQETMTKEEKFNLIIQVNGKTRGSILARRGISKKDAEKLAMNKMGQNKIIKSFFVSDRLINIIIN